MILYCAYVHTGMEITDLMMISDDAVLFVSKGADFVPPRAQGEEGSYSELDGTSGIPALVGGYKVILGGATRDA